MITTARAVHILYTVSNTMKVGIHQLFPHGDGLSLSDISLLFPDEISIGSESGLSPPCRTSLCTYTPHGLTEDWLIVGPLSRTLAQHYSIIGSLSRARAACPGVTGERHLPSTGRPSLLCYSTPPPPPRCATEKYYKSESNP